jgi:hypothetical protein
MDDVHIKYQFRLSVTALNAVVRNCHVIEENKMM